MKNTTPSELTHPAAAQFYQIREEWSAVANKHYKMGATDTEPRTVLSILLRSAFSDGVIPTKMPDARGWQLYFDFADTPQMAEALKDLNEVTYRLLTCALDMPVVAYVQVNDWYGLF